MADTSLTNIPPVLVPSNPIVLTFGAWSEWTDRIQASPAGNMTNPSYNGQNLYLCVIPGTGNAPSNPPSSGEATEIILPGQSWVGTDLGAAQRVFVAPVSTGSPIAQPYDVLEGFPAGLVAYGGAVGSFAFATAANQTLEINALDAIETNTAQLSLNYIDITKLNFLGQTAAVTVGVVFVDTSSNQLSASEPLTIPLANGSTAAVALTSISGGIPTGAVGIYMTFPTGSSSIIFCPTASASDMETNYARYPVLIADPQYVTFGKVAN